MQNPQLQLSTPQPPPQRVSPVFSIRITAVIALIFLVFLAIAVLFEYRTSPIKKRAPLQTAAAEAASDRFAGITLQARSAVVFDATNNKILYDKNPDAQLPLASLTKIPLAIAVSEVLAPDSAITVASELSSGNGERLSKGKWSVRNIIDFTLVASSNDGAELLAKAADGAMRSRYSESPEEGAVLWRMNGIAKELGLSRTFFINESGLDESETLSGAYGSALDMAVLFSFAAGSHPSIFSGTSKDGVILNGGNGQGDMTVYNTNEAAGHIPGLVMGKTGITDLAGGNLAVVFDADRGHRIVAVVLGSSREGRFVDMRKLVDRAREALAQK